MRRFGRASRYSLRIAIVRMTFAVVVLSGIERSDSSRKSQRDRTGAVARNVHTFALSRRVIIYKEKKKREKRKRKIGGDEHTAHERCATLATRERSCQMAPGRTFVGAKRAPGLPRTRETPLGIPFAAPKSGARAGIPPERARHRAFRPYGSHLALLSSPRGMRERILDAVRVPGLLSRALIASALRDRVGAPLRPRPPCGRIKRTENGRRRNEAGSELSRRSPTRGVSLISTLSGAVGEVRLRHRSRRNSERLGTAIVVPSS